MLDARFIMTSVGLLLEQSSNSIACRRDWRETCRHGHGIQHRSLDQRKGTYNPPKRIASQPLPSLKRSISSNVSTFHHCLDNHHVQNTQLQQNSNFTLSGTPASNRICTHPPLPVRTTGLTSPHFGFTGITGPPNAIHPMPATVPKFPPLGS